MKKVNAGINKVEDKSYTVWHSGWGKVDKVITKKRNRGIANIQAFMGNDKSSKKTYSNP